jgi:Family of unknown function (DUF6221)
MDDLVAFVRQQLDERERQLDEDQRKALAANAGGAWRYEGGDSVGAWTLYDESWEIASLTTYRHTDYDYASRMPAVPHPRYVDADANGDHIARWDPSRALEEVRLGRAEVEAKRRILDACLKVYGDEGGSLIGELPEIVLRSLARPYAGRLGWRDEWGA